jgi:glutamine amidotransferase
MLGYVGQRVALAELIERPPHSLEKQSYAARELVGATVNADGWGFGLYLEQDPTPMLYRSILPIWGDVNRSDLGRALHSTAIVAAVRSATNPLSICHANTPPFGWGRLLLAHNGYIEGFTHSLMRRMRGGLRDSTYAAVVGDTDSEHIYAVIEDEYSSAEGLADRARLCAAVRNGARRVLALAEAEKVRALVSLVVTDGVSLVALRAAVGAEPPSLYVRPEPSEELPGAVAASEPLESEARWVSVSAGELVLLDGHGDAEYSPL